MVCVEDLSCKLGHKSTGMLSTIISMRALPCMLNYKITKMLMQKGAACKCRRMTYLVLEAILVKISKSTMSRSDLDQCKQT